MNTRMMFARAGGECCHCGTAAALCAMAVKNVAKSNANYQ